MAGTIIKNIESYFRLLNKVLSFHEIELPKDAGALIRISQDRRGRIVGWEINQKWVEFLANGKLKCHERSTVASTKIMGKDVFNIDEYSFHFSPAISTMLEYRIDLDDGNELHLNPDPSLKETLGDHIPPFRLHFNINDFNCIMAIVLALEYIRLGFYPTDAAASVYNEKLDLIRRAVC